MNKKTAGFWVKTVVTALLIAVLIINIFTVVFSKLGLRRTLNWVPGAFVTIESGSMEPTLSKGDLIFVWRTSYGKLEIGDVITTFSGEEFVTHSIVYVGDEQIITKGLQNEKEDAPVGEKEYCAKMLFAVPGGAKLWKTISEPVVTVILALLIAVMFFGVPLFTFIYSKFSKNGEKWERPGLIRITSALASVSLLFTAPFLSSAKYSADINGFVLSTASTYYFSSNYLSEVGNTYNIKGWKGDYYSFNLALRNYKDTLKFNGNGKNVKYYIYIEQIGTDGETSFNNNYTVQFMDGNTPYAPLGDGSDDVHALHPGDVYGPFTLTGSDSERIEQSFKLIVNHKEGTSAFEAGDKIRFKVTAETDTTDYYHYLISGLFTFEVTSATSFIRTHEISNVSGSNVIDYSLKTNQIAGMDQRRVVLQWDPHEITLPNIDHTLMSLISSGAQYDQEHGTLTMDLQSNMSIKFQFIKYAGFRDDVFDDYVTENQTMHVGDVDVDYDLITISRIVPEEEDPGETPQGS